MAHQHFLTENEHAVGRPPRLRIRSEENELPNRIRTAIGNEPVAAFGRRCGINESTLRKYFSGTLPNIENLVAIADAANVSIEWLATGRGPKQRGASSSIPVIPPAPPLPASEISLEDIERLTMAMEAVEEGLGARYHQLTPAKRAQIVAAAYDLLLDTEQRQTVVKFVKLAA